MMDIQAPASQPLCTTIPGCKHHPPFLPGRYLQPGSVASEKNAGDIGKRLLTLSRFLVDRLIDIAHANGGHLLSLHTAPVGILAIPHKMILLLRVCGKTLGGLSTGNANF